MPRTLPILIIAITLLTACSHRSGSSSDFDKVLYEPEYAIGYRITGTDEGRSTMLTVKNPWQGADSVVTRLLIRRNGEPIPPGFDGQVVDGDASRIIAMSSTHIAMLDAIGEVRRVKGVSGLGYISTPWIAAHPDSVTDIGYDGNIDYEALVGLAPDIVLLYGINAASPMENKLRELGIPYVYLGDYLEQSPLGKAEWLVALAEITGQRQKAIEAFAPIAKEYNQLRERVASEAQGAPSVMLNMPYGDTWFMPSAENYTVRLINDAGGRFVYDKNTGNQSMPVDLEEAWTLASQADKWIVSSTATTLSDVRNACPRFADIRCMRQGEVYNNNLRSTPAGGNDYYESAVVRPHIVLRDLVKILHPEIAGDSTDFVHFQKLR